MNKLGTLKLGVILLAGAAALPAFAQTVGCPEGFAPDGSCASRKAPEKQRNKNNSDSDKFIQLLHENLEGLKACQGVSLHLMSRGGLGGLSTKKADDAKKLAEHYEDLKKEIQRDPKVIVEKLEGLNDRREKIQSLFVAARTIGFMDAVRLAGGMTKQAYLYSECQKAGGDPYNDPTRCIPIMTGATAESVRDAQAMTDYMYSLSYSQCFMAVGVVTKNMPKQWWKFW